MHIDVIANQVSAVLREKYPDETEQIDAIWKILKHLRDNGTDLGPEGAMLDEILSVKTSIRKPSGL